LDGLIGAAGAVTGAIDLGVASPFPFAEADRPWIKTSLPSRWSGSIPSQSPARESDEYRRRLAEARAVVSE
jgi:hypothetical protein